MTEQEKSLALAKLMGWKVEQKEFFNDVDCCYRKGCWEVLCPYKGTTVGSAQFAAILLAFPEVMAPLINMYRALIVSQYNEQGSPTFRFKRKPTQRDVLDEILRMKGVRV